MNPSETLFLYENEDFIFVVSIDGSIYGIGGTSDEAIEDAIEEGGFTEEELAGLASEESHWWDDEDEEEYL